MELVEPIKDINIKLQREYGVETDGTPRWRVVWSEDMLEKRWMTHTTEGWPLLYPEVREVRKYQHIVGRYVLERQVPVFGETDITTKTSFEPAWTFEDRHGNYLPPQYQVAKIVIDAIHSQMDHAGFTKKYDDPNATQEERLANIERMEKTLFGNETPVGDALAHKFGVTDFHQKVDFSEEKNNE